MVWFWINRLKYISTYMRDFYIFVVHKAFIILNIFFCHLWIYIIQREKTHNDELFSHDKGLQLPKTKSFFFLMHSHCLRSIYNEITIWIFIYLKYKLFSFPLSIILYIYVYIFVWVRIKLFIFKKLIFGNKELKLIFFEY